MVDSKRENRNRPVEAGESSLAAAEVRACRAAAEAWRRRGEGGGLGSGLGLE